MSTGSVEWNGIIRMSLDHTAASIWLESYFSVVVVRVKSQRPITTTTENRNQNGHGLWNDNGILSYNVLSLVWPHATQ